MPLSLLLAIVLLVGLYLWVRSRRTGLRSSRRFPALTKSQPAVQPHTRRQLLRLVHGNQAMARRLVSQVKVRYPHQSDQWCWEKAIYDIQRDRRSY